jgi:hypothetical protein
VTLASHSIFVHCVSVFLQALLLLAGKLTQQIADEPRVLVCLLLHLALSNGVERAEQPHLLQVADESLQVFGGFDLFVGSPFSLIFGLREQYRHSVEFLDLDFPRQVIANGPSRDIVKE